MEIPFLSSFTDSPPSYRLIRRRSNNKIMPAKTIPKLPLTCLKTADNKSTEQVVKGKNTIIDFWTTKCTRCPDALDKLNEMAQDPKYKDVQFISIVCDKLDGARDIIEEQDDLRWQNVNHYFMDKDDKEKAKEILGFKQVPFYVVMDENGSITQSGSGRQVDFNEVPGIIRNEDDDESKSSSRKSDSSSSFLSYESSSNDENKENIHPATSYVTPLPSPVSSEDDFGDADDFGDDDFQLDFNNRTNNNSALSELDDEQYSPPKPHRMIDESLFELDDF